MVRRVAIVVVASWLLACSHDAKEVAMDLARSDGKSPLPDLTNGGNFADGGIDMAFGAPPDLVGAPSVDLTPSAAQDLAGVPIIMPDDPGAADYTTTIDTTNATDRHPISRLIYGYNFLDSGNSYPKNLTFDRLGGDRMCSYNWEKNVENSGGQNNSDPYFYDNNYNFYGSASNDAQIASDVFEAIDTNRARNAVTMPILPLMDYVAADHAGKIDITPAGKNTYLSHFLVNTLDSGMSPTTSAPAAPDLADGIVKQDEFANYLRWHYSTVTDIFTDPVKRVIIGLDNEPELWIEAFAILQRSPDHKYKIDMSGLGPESAWMPPDGDTTIGYKVEPQAFIDRTKTVTAMLRRMIPDAQIMGPSHFGWDAMINFNDNTWKQYDMAATWFMDDYLSQLKTAADASGVRTLDVFDFHWYPSATTATGTTRVLDMQTTTSDAEFDALVQNPRSYWDTTYTETSYITKDHTKGPINLLARIQSRIDAAYPGTYLGITEYYPGGGSEIAGAIAEADTLGVFGRFGLYVAALWPYYFDENARRFVHGGMKMFRSYDLADGMFGDTSVHTVFSATDQGSAYASVDAGSDERVVVVVINKQKTAKTTALKITHTKKLSTAEVYLLSGTNPNPVKQANLTLSKTNAMVYSMPARSVTTLVFTP